MACIAINSGDNSFPLANVPPGNLDRSMRSQSKSNHEASLERLAGEADQHGGRAMFHSWMRLGIEANRVIGLRMMKLMRGGKSAQREARLMVTEKVDAAMEANARIMAGASADEIIRTYRRRVAANAKRLAKRNFGTTVLKGKRRKRKWL